MDVLDLIGTYSFGNDISQTKDETEIQEFKSACESIEDILETERSMYNYQQFRNAEAPQVALEAVQEVLTTFICREVGLESGSELTLNAVCAGFGCTPEMLGLGTEAETADETGNPSRGRALLNKIKLGGKAAGNAIGAGWTRVVESVKSLLGLTMIASTAFEKIEKSTTLALSKLNSIQNTESLSDVQVEGVNIEEFKGSIEHYKSLIAILEKVNKSKGGESSQVVNSIYLSLPKLLGIDGTSDSELLSAAKTLRTTAREKAVNLKNKTTYAGAEGLNVVKNTLSALNKTAQNMKNTADYRDLVSSLKAMKKGLTPEDAKKLKVIVQVLNYYIKASSDILRSLTKGADSLLKVSKRFEKLTGSSKAKDVVASTESFQVNDLMASLKEMSMGMESYGYDLGIAVEQTENASSGYTMMDGGLETIMIALDAFDYTEMELENFIAEKRDKAISPQIDALERYGLEHGIESEELSFAMMNGISFIPGTEADDSKKEGFLSAAWKKIQNAWKYICNKVNEFWTWVSGKSRVFGSLEVSIKKLINWVKNKYNIAKGKLSAFLHKIPGYNQLEKAIVDTLRGIQIKYYCIKAYFANPVEYTKNSQRRSELINLLTSESLQISALSSGSAADSLMKKYNAEYDKNVDGIEGLPDVFKNIMKAAKDKDVVKAKQKAKELESVYGEGNIPDLTAIGNAILKAKTWCSNKWNSAARSLAELIQKVKDYFVEKKKEETK